MGLGPNSILEQIYGSWDLGWVVKDFFFGFTIDLGRKISANTSTWDLGLGIWVQKYTQSNQHGIRDLRFGCKNIRKHINMGFGTWDSDWESKLNKLLCHDKKATTCSSWEVEVGGVGEILTGKNNGWGFEIFERFSTWIWEIGRKRGQRYVP